MVRTGLDRLPGRWPSHLHGARVGLVVHPASVNRKLEHATRVFGKGGPWKLTTLFGPQHGIHGQTQDNMVEWEGFRHPTLGCTVFSLYGKHRKPTPRMLENVDVLVIDLQDIGSRYYTFIWTLDLCLEAAGELGLEVVVLDRPNPIGGRIVEGPVLDARFSSFVGRKPMPVRHGMTIGEVARYLRGDFHPATPLTVIPMGGWKRDMLFPDTGLPWVMPSPNMPSLETALVYPGLCLLEGTNLSEGRGTTRPFEFFGAPFVSPEDLVRSLEASHLPGVVFRPVHFEPTFQKHAGRLCGGAQIHIRSVGRFRPFRTGTVILQTMQQLYPDHFRWKQPPYEYEEKKLPIDILAGTDALRQTIERGIPLDGLQRSWKNSCAKFLRRIRGKYWLYE